MTTEETLMHLERSLLKPEVRTSVAKLTALIHPDFQEIGASGYRFGRDEVLQRCPTELGWTADVSEMECRRLDDNLYQVLFTAFIRRDNQDTGSKSYRSSLWQREGDNWRMIFHQGTSVASTG